MDDLGAYLRKLREEKGITYKRIFNDLRLREDQVRQIEDNYLDGFGTPGIALAILRKYAQYLEADLPAVTRRLEIMLPGLGQREFSPKRPIKEKKILLSPNLLWLIGIIVFVIILGSIVWYAYNQGWLKTPELFKRATPDTTAVAEEAALPVRPDSLRERMRLLSESPGTKSGDGLKTSGSDSAREALRDTTDYLGGILGPSPVNVPLH